MSSAISSSWTSRSRVGPVIACTHFSRRGTALELGREDALQFAQHRARAAHRDAQVVQELAVEVLQDAVDVGLR